MFIDRDLLKASDISFLGKMDRLKILAFATKLCEKNGYDSEIFCGIKERSFKGFESNNCLLYTSPSPRDSGKSRMPSSA